MTTLGLKNSISRRSLSIFKDHFDKVDKTKGKLSLQGKKPPTMNDPHRRLRIPNVKSVILVSSGKGGVGKSTVATNVAVALQLKSKNVALLDADIYGPSIPRMMNLENEKAEVAGNNRLVPLENYGIQCMSMGFLLPSPTQAVIWRGPMLQKSVHQLIYQVDWRPNTDILVVDMPPGTGDVGMTIGMGTVVDGAVIVTTPQDIALLDVKKGIDMFNKLKVQTIGVIENMSYFTCPKCSHKTSIFGGGKANSKLSQEILHGKSSLKEKIDVLGRIPLDADICQYGDDGRPVTLVAPEAAASLEYLNIAERILYHLDKKE